MMKRLSLILMLLSLVVVQHIHAQYYSVNYDARTRSEERRVGKEC